MKTIRLLNKPAFEKNNGNSIIVRFDDNGKKPAKKSDLNFKNCLSLKIWLNQEKIVKKVRIDLNLTLKKPNKSFLSLTLGQALIVYS